MRNRDPVGLSTREAEIVQLLAEGYSNRQIARHLSLAESTVKRHLSRILGKLGVRTRSQAVSVVAKGELGGGGWAELTARQIEVVRLLAEGYSNQQIAESLAISPRTVKAHLEHIRQRLGVRGRIAVVAAVRRGEAETTTWSTGSTARLPEPPTRRKAPRPKSGGSGQEGTPMPR